jgi:hypothetical protein
MARVGRTTFAEDLFSPAKPVGPDPLEDEAETEPVDEDEQKKRKALKRKKRLLEIVAKKW